MLKLSGIIDFIFGTTFVFATCFLWTRYFLHNFVLSILLSAIISFCVVLLYILLRRKKTEKALVAKSELAAAHDISTFFLLSTKPETIKAFETIVSQKHSVKTKGNLVIADKVALCPIYTRTEITDKDVLDSFAKIKNTNIEKIIICCQNASAKAKDIANIITTKQIVIYNEFDAYKYIFKPANFKVEPQLKQKKTSAKQRLLKCAQMAFNKSRTKSYLMVSFILLLSSFVLRYNLYYLIVATTTTALALYSHFNTKFNTSKTEQVMF